MALYFVGDTPQGPRLYREYQQLPDDPLAALEAITKGNGPDDPDYRTVWPAGVFQSVAVGDRQIDVELDVEVWGDLGISPDDSELATQQVVYTLQAATGTQLPVRFWGWQHEPLSFVPPLERLPQNEVLALVNVNDPIEGLRVTDSFVARGRANSFEGNVLWQLVDANGALAAEGFATAEGSVDHLYPWETEPIDVSQLSPGRYTFVAMTSDPSGGAEGSGPFTDTRTIIVE